MGTCIVVVGGVQGDFPVSEVESQKLWDVSPVLIENVVGHARAVLVDALDVKVVIGVVADSVGDGVVVSSDGVGGELEGVALGGDDDVELVGVGVLVGGQVASEFVGVDCVGATEDRA